jgi:tripartite-type tricarboxylate transporter receptor subunit TctC
VETVQDFMTAAKRKDAVISYGSVGIGSAVHISAEKFRLAAGFEAAHIPYRGGSEVIADILGGRIDFYFCPLATALPLIRDGQVRALVVSTTKRVPDLPDVPTPAEAGLVNADSAIWIGVFMPAKTPRDIVDRFHAAGSRALADPPTRQSLAKMGVEAVPMSPAEMDALVRTDLAANAELIKAAGIKQ